MNRLQEIQEKISQWFFWFWIRQYRISYLVVLTLIILGSVAIINIPKESSPSVKLGTVLISTAYPWTSPVDIDSLISDKIYKEIKDVKWIDKITSTSSLGISTVTATLKTDANTKDVINDIRNNVNKLQFPSDAKTPTITEIETDTNRTFSVFLYKNTGSVTKPILIDRALTLKKEIEKISGIDSVEITAGGWQWPVNQWWWDDSAYTVNIIIDDDRAHSLGISLGTIAWIIQSYNKDQPIGNYALGNKKYDFRIEGKNKESFDFMKTPIPLSKGWVITLSEIATIERKYKNNTKNILTVWADGIAHEFIGIAVNKTDGASIFSASKKAKEKITEIMIRPEFKEFSYIYGNDLANNISDDYNELMSEAITTLVLVFIAMYLFVWFRDSLFATVTLPLAFLSTFLILYYGGYTMNFLTNFSLILSFGIAVDTIIVIVQAASAKIRVGYNPSSAIMLALREYAIPVISWVLTTIVVFIPMMTLPGILGKFLSFIPITIFSVLATWLILALTVNSSLYLLFVKKRENYVDDPHAIEYATDEEKELLILEREWKQKINEGVAPIRIRLIHKVTEGYKDLLRKFLESTYLRRIAIIIPVVFLFLGFIVFAPRVWFELFPSDDNNILTATIEWPVWQRIEKTESDLKWLQGLFAWYKEIEYISTTISWNKWNITFQLRKKKDRKAEWLMDVFAFEKVLSEKLKTYEIRWYKVVAEALKGWPPWSKSIGIKLIAENADKLSTLINVSKDFESYLKKMEWTKNISRSSSDTPGQFIFRLKKDLLWTYAISPSLIYSQISQNLSGINVWTIEDNWVDMDIKIKTSKFGDDVRVEDILSIPIPVGNMTYRVWDFVDSTITNATATVSRENGKIQITVESNLEKWLDTVGTQAKLIAFAEKYNFPNWISYERWGENESNKELLVAVISAFFLSIIVIFAILTLQFNSFSQPAIVLYSVIMSLPFVMLWLLLTDNKFSMPFGIGFIAFTGIAVNHGIILIDAINQNLKKWMNGFIALVEAWSSRLEPMVLTTVTTVLWILPIALRDKFWSGMGFTIIFGIIATTFLTLFVVKWIYYELYIAKHESILGRIWKIVKNMMKKGRRINNTHD